VKLFCVLCLLLGLGFPVHALDREAFSISHYDLNARIDAEQQRIGVRGILTLRNDSSAPQQTAVLQISSTLHWASISIQHKPAEYLTQAFTSDLDHTGALSEAIVTFPRAIAPKQTVELEIGYEGVISQDATRLARIGVPDTAAKDSDWDAITSLFTAVRGIGYVAWYPIATESANLSDAASVSVTVGRWKRREREAEMKVLFIAEGGNTPGQNFYCSGTGNGTKDRSGASSNSFTCTFASLDLQTPVFASAKYGSADHPNVGISYLPQHTSGADDYALAVEQVSPWLTAWLGDHRTPGDKARVLDLPNSADSPFQTGNLLLIPLAGNDTTYLLAAVHQMTSLLFPSPQVWVSGGLALYAQARYMKDQNGETAGLTYLQGHAGPLLDAEKGEKQERSARSSLLDSDDGLYVESKGMAVWWMLHDIVGDTALSAALHNYKADQDTSADYVQKLIEAQTQRDLSWFFNDWVYHDRGLPEFRIDSVFLSKVPSGGYMVTVTVENQGGASAEVPVTLKTPSGDVTQRLLVDSNSKKTVRILAAHMPTEAVVNDGSVPETDLSNNAYKIDAAVNE
jgi:hypothetical protein